MNNKRLLKLALRTKRTYNELNAAYIYLKKLQKCDAMAMRIIKAAIAMSDEYDDDLMRVIVTMTGGK